jgi:uncharacterized protein (TIGR02271 family)
VRRFSLANEEHRDRFAQGARSSLEGYQAYDVHYENTGKVDDLFVDDDGQPRYVGVKTGLLGTRTTLIPIELVRVNDKRKLVEIEADTKTIKGGPTFGDREITSEFEQRVLSYYRAEIKQASSAGREEDVAHYPDATGDGRVGLRPSEHATRTRGHSGEEDRLSATRSGMDRESSEEFGSEDEVRVQRVEEELRAGARKLDAEGVRVRKQVRTDCERLAVPKKRQEVRMKRVPVEEGATVSEPEIGEDEVRIPVIEEEIVIEKRPVVKEEIRLRKEVVEEEEVLEEDVRKEEVDIDDQTERRNG